MLNIGKNADGSFQVKFSVKAAPGSVVGVAGSFNDWDPEQAPMTSCGEGIFQTHMLVRIHNDGPVTILLDSNKLF